MDSAEKKKTFKTNKIMKGKRKKTNQQKYK